MGLLIKVTINSYYKQYYSYYKPTYHPCLIENQVHTKLSPLQALLPSGLGIQLLNYKKDFPGVNCLWNPLHPSQTSCITYLPIQYHDDVPGTTSYLLLSLLLLFDCHHDQYMSHLHCNEKTWTYLSLYRCMLVNPRCQEYGVFWPKIAF